MQTEMMTDIRSPEFLPAWYDARALVAAEWAPSIAVALVDGPLQYKDILVAVRRLHPAHRWSERHTNLHESILSRTLNRMTSDGLLERHEASVKFPPTVHYSLTSEFDLLLESFRTVARWSLEHGDLIAQAQRQRRE